MEHIYSRGQAKINLALDITGRRDDGYHAIDTVMQSLTLYDSLFIKKVYKPDYLKLVSNLTWLPNDERNLVWQAAHYLIQRFDIKTGVFISVQKAIPASAGLGGGSADCAATLLGMRDLFKLPLTNDEIIELSVRFGADVPFCVMRGLARATGIGEVLQPLPRLPLMYVLLAKPPVIVSTADIFANFVPENVKARPDIERLVHGTRSGNLAEITSAMGNALESVTVERHPIVNELKEFMMAQGAKRAMMTGSGPAVFGIFECEKSADAARNALRAAFSDIKEVFVTKPFYI